MALTVLKIGGSLSCEPKKLRSLMGKLDALSKIHPLVVVPGGGEFADVVRKLDKRFSLKSQVSHRMAILAMDQYGLVLSDLSANSVVVRSFEETKNAAFSGYLPVFLPSQVMFTEDPLENSWEVTSDSIALYIAYRLQAGKVMFVTDVDGIFTADPKKEKDARLINELSADGLAAMKTRTSVDSALPRLLMKWPITCFVVNGCYPERVESLLKGKETTATMISGEKL